MNIKRKTYDEFIGQKFGRLTVVSFSHRIARKDGSGYYAFLKVRCDCGKETEARIDRLKSGEKSSCECLHKEMCGNLNRKHGQYKSKIYGIWTQMIERCENPKALNYRWYGARGISVSVEWHDFHIFYQDMGDRPEGHSLDRIDNNGNYCKANCRWATIADQLKNRRKPQGSRANDAPR